MLESGDFVTVAELAAREGIAVSYLTRVLRLTQLGDIASDGYAALSIPNPAQTLIHIHADPQELGRVYQPELAINATPAAFAEAIARLEVVPNPRC